jgi:hypothetical protein
VARNEAVVWMFFTLLARRGRYGKKGNDVMLFTLLARKMRIIATTPYLVEKKGNSFGDCCLPYCKDWQGRRRLR